MILVTGSNGQLGSDVCRCLAEKKEEFVGIDVDTLDLTNEGKVRLFFSKNKPSALIHCAAYTAVDKAEDERERCMSVNFKATETLAQCCKEYDCKMLYISTDYVFAGEGEKPFETGDKKSPMNVYGESKLLGEQAVLRLCEKYFIVRTSWVFGEKNTNFIYTMLNLSKTHDFVNVVSDQTGSPTYSKHLAQLICAMIQTEKYGVYHATNEGYCTWSELARLTFKLTKSNTAVIDVTSDEFSSKAKRPHNSRLSKRSLDKAGFSRLPKWEAAVEEYLENIIQ